MIASAVCAGAGRATPIAILPSRRIRFTIVVCVMVNKVNK
jgi:hypothetical protein